MARKKKQEEHENHERWLVSYADFITLLFAFFVSMYAISTVNEGKYKALSESLQAAFTTTSTAAIFSGAGTGGTGGGTGEVSRLEAGEPPKISDRFRQNFSPDFKRISRALQSLKGKTNMTLMLDERGIVVRLSQPMLFKAGRAELKSDAYKVLDEIASAIKSTARNIRIEGHTDNIPVQSKEYPTNWDLSSARALVVLKYLLSAHSFDPTKISASGYGEYRPVATNDTLRGRAKNRRVDIVLLNSYREDTTP
ncbi:Flagellar motor rotation protein MotB [hydrothermal vent metagenome]|uniref:Flagellar motor rotation protein MotB n=1 Tax=hydrothermal vent metagenome TaxID=652676 RepID=A0A3B0V776_9ZZZZ